MNLSVNTNRVRGVAFCSVLLTAAAVISASAAPMAQARGRGVFTTHAISKDLSAHSIGRDLEPRSIESGIKHDFRTVDATLRRTLDLRHRL